MKTRHGGMTLLALGCAAIGMAAPARLDKPGELFERDRVHTVHLRFTAEQWAAIEPAERGPGGGPGGPGGPGGGRGRGGFGGPMGGPGPMLAPAFLAGDTDKDGRLSRAEFQALGAAWFAKFDTARRGTLTVEELRAGLRGVLPAPPFGGPMGGGPMGGPMGGGPMGGPMGGMPDMDANFPRVHGSLDLDGHEFADVSVRYKGNNSFMTARNSIKKSFKIDLNKFVKGQKLATVTTLNLHNNITDPSWMNEPLSYQLYRDAGVPAGRTAYARVYVTVPGTYERKYFGLYTLVENVDKHFLAERFGEAGGALLKPSTRALFTYQGDDWSRYEKIYDPKSDLTKAQKARLIALMKLITSGSDAEVAAGLPGYVDLDETARYFAATVWLATMDSILGMGHNYYVYLDPKTNRIQLLPWDLDHSFGQFMGAGPQLSIDHPWQGQNRFLERLFGHAEFQKLYRARLAEFNGGIFRPERVTAMVEATAKAIRGAVSEESAEALARFDRTAAGQAAGGAGGMGPRGPGGGKPIKAFVGPRAASVAAQLRGEKVPEGGEGGFPGRGPGGRRGGGFDPAAMMERPLLEAFDPKETGRIDRASFTATFARWFAAWDTEKRGSLTAAQVAEGISRDLMPFPGGPR